MITEREIELLAKLSKLHLTAEEKVRMMAEMSDIVAFADTINASLTEETDGVGESDTVINYEGLREDEVRPSYPPERLLENADSENGYFLVRRNSTK